jgi:hypothetical protein
MAMLDWRNVVLLTRGTDLSMLLERASRRLPSTLDVTADTGQLQNLVGLVRPSIVVVDARHHTRVIESVPELIHLVRRLGAVGIRTVVVTPKRASGRYNRYLRQLAAPVHLLEKSSNVTRFQAMLREFLDVEPVEISQLRLLALDPMRGFDAIIPHLDAGSWQQACLTIETATRRLARLRRQLRS